LGGDFWGPTAWLYCAALVKGKVFFPSYTALPWDKDAGINRGREDQLRKGCVCRQRRWGNDCFERMLVVVMVLRQAACQGGGEIWGKEKMNVARIFGTSLGTLIVTPLLWRALGS